MENLEASICLDTGVVIDILRKKEETILWLTSLPEECSISITLITLFELYRGAYIGLRQKEEVGAIDILKEQMIILPLTPEHMQKAAEESVILQKKGTGIDIRDLLIGICAREEKCILKTHNKKHFKKISGLIVAE